MMKKDLIVFATNFLKGGSGFETRVRMECNYLKDIYNITILTTDSTEKKEWMNEFSFKTLPTTKINIPKLRVIINKMMFKKYILELLKHKPDSILYCESLNPLIYSSKVKNKATIVYDCHGAQPEEKAFTDVGIIGKLSSIYMKRMETMMLKHCKLVVTVTDKQCEYFRTKVKHVKFPMVPSSIFFDTTNYRDRTRKKLGIDKDMKVFVYSGGADKWQMCEETVAFYKRIEETLPDSYFLILTAATDVFDKLAKKHNLSRYKILSCNYEEMPMLLDACDYGFCLRKNIVVNNVASPTKVYEYLARNVKPIITDCIGDFSKELKKRGLACVIPEQDAVNGNHFNAQSLQIGKTIHGMEYTSYVSQMFIDNYIKAMRMI